MVLPQDRLTTKLSHIGMINGKKIIKVETFNQNGNKVCFLATFGALCCYTTFDHLFTEAIH